MGRLDDLVVFIADGTRARGHSQALAIRGDLHDGADQLDAAIDRTVRELGRLDLVVAREGVFTLVPPTRRCRRAGGRCARMAG